MRLLPEVAREERPALAWAFAYFFLLLASYYVLRPVRDSLAVGAGAKVVQELLAWTFVAMLALVPAYGALCARLPRARFLPVVYGFFALNLVAFYVEMDARVFFVWLNVFNLFAVSVFWSLMSDLFSPAQAKRLFGAIAAGGSCGAISGPALTAAGASLLGTHNLLLLAALLLLGALGAMLRLLAWGRAHPRPGEASEEPAGGTLLAGARAALTSPYLLAICGYLFCYTVLSTSLYFQQLEIVGRDLPNAAERTRFFALVDFTVNALALLVQVFLTARLTERLGPAWMLALMPLVSLAGFASLGIAPTLAVLLVVGVTRRVGEFAISKPVREALYTVVSREDRYKAKGFTDTVVYRGGDALSGWTFGLLKAAGWGAGAIAWAAVPVAAAWVALAAWLGTRYRDRVRT